MQIVPGLNPSHIRLVVAVAAVAALVIIVVVV